jgi:hypothetical protein
MMKNRNVRSRRKSGHQPVFTIGHSTRSIDEFIGLLRSNGVERLIDIRSIPKSRHNPQFHGNSLARALRAASIDYVHLKDLGGLRRARSDSPNTAWRNASFRGYADYMQTEEFEKALARAIELACEKRSALMCAEAVPWRCHRSLVADAFVVRGIEVLEIVGSSRPKPHGLTPFAVVRGTSITYPADKTGALFGSRRESPGEPNRAPRDKSAGPGLKRVRTTAQADAALPKPFTARSMPGAASARS